MSRDQTTSRRTIRPAQGAAKLGVSLPSFWRYARTDPSFPKLFKLTPSVTVAYEDELDAWVASRRDAALPARAQQPRSPKRATTTTKAATTTAASTSPEQSALLAALAALRAAGVNTLDDLARAMAATAQPGPTPDIGTSRKRRTAQPVALPSE